MHCPVTADEASNPTASEWLVPLVFPLETPQYWGYLVASPKVGAASSRENFPLKVVMGLPVNGNKQTPP